MNAAPPSRQAAAARPTRAAAELGLAGALWRRDMMRLARAPARWIGGVVQPLLFWLLLGSGLGSVFTLRGVGELSYLQFFFPGLLVMVVLFTTIFAMMAVIEDRQHGILQQVLTAPGSRTALVLGKIAGVATVALVQVLLTLLAAPAAGFDLGAVAWPSLATAFLTGTAGLTALSFTLAWVLRSTAGYHALMAVFLLPLWLVSGAMFPPAAGWLGALMTANPMTYLVDAFRHALHGGTAPVALASPAVAQLVLLGFALLLTALAVTVARRVPGASR